MMLEIRRETSQILNLVKTRITIGRAIKTVISLLAVVLLTKLVFWQIPLMPDWEPPQTQGMKIFGAIFLGILTLLTYGTGLFGIISDIAQTLKGKKVEYFFLPWIIFILGLILLGMFLGIVQGKIHWIFILFD